MTLQPFLSTLKSLCFMCLPLSTTPTSISLSSPAVSASAMGPSAVCVAAHWPIWPWWWLFFVCWHGQMWRHCCRNKGSSLFCVSYVLVQVVQSRHLLKKQYWPCCDAREQGPCNTYTAQQKLRKSKMGHFGAPPP